MAAILEVVTATDDAQGPIILSYTSDAVGRVVDFTCDFKDALLEIMGGNPEQVVSIIQTGKGSGKITVTLDEVADFDNTTVRGFQASVKIMQTKPKATTKRWSLTAATAYVNVLSWKGDRNKNVSTCVLEITPYAAVGSTLWAFDPDEADA